MSGVPGALSLMTQVSALCKGARCSRKVHQRRPLLLGVGGINSERT